KIVSIITPMYNAERFVAQTIESVIAQTYPYWEMLIVDDGSTDNCAKIVQEYVQKDTRIQLIVQKNAGSAAARNNGLRQAKGTYICLLDADDLWESIFLEEQIKLMNEKNASFVCSSHKRIDENGKECLQPFIVPAQATYYNLLKTCSISCLTAMYNCEVIGKHYLNEKLKSLRDDFAYWLELIKISKVVYGNKKVLASYRVLNNSATGNKRKMIKPQFLVYYKIENLGLLRSLYYTIIWAINGFLKYRK
ncbi:MAG: glycosyltransferase family 2 protein, partial [Cellulosilyticaceae bacterium]